MSRHLGKSRSGWTKRLSAETSTDPSLQSTSVTKFHSRVCIAQDGTKLKSKLELRRYEQLLLLQMGGIVSGLEVNRRWSLDLLGVHLCKYEADFSYRDEDTGRLVVEDCKGYTGGKTETPAYRLFKLKKRLMLALHGVDVIEITG